MEIEFPLVSKSQKVCSAAPCFKNVRACLPLGQQERNAHASAVERQLSQTNNSSVKPFWATQAPANRLHLPHSADRSQRSGGCGMTTKKSGMSGMCGLKSWVFGYASLHGNGIFLDLKKSKDLCGSTMLQKIRACFPLSTQERERERERDANRPGSCRKQTTLQYSPFGPHKLPGQLCPTRLTEVRDFKGLWNDNKEKSGMWSEVMGLWACNSAWKWSFPRSKSQKVCLAALCFKNVRACLPPGQQHRNANANAIETAVANKQLFKGLWNENKEKSGMSSEVMGLWVCNSAWKLSFPWSQKVKRSVRQHRASKMSEPVCRLANKREMQMPAL